jgi:hypothetical protein
MYLLKNDLNFESMKKKRKVSEINCKGGREPLTVQQNLQATHPVNLTRSMNAEKIMLRV